MIPGEINAWWPFGPSNSRDCILKYQKKAKCEKASTLINIACKCKFKPKKHDPLSQFQGCNYDPHVYDCILDNISDAQNDQAALTIFISCVGKHNK